MNWKKIMKYAVIIFVVLTMAFIFLANRNIIEIYGGLTEHVDFEQFESQVGPIAVTNVNVLSPDGASFLADQTVLIENGLITAIDPQLEIAFQFATINGTGKYLIPGLTDAHVHLFRSPNDLLLYVANGVTQIRELIGLKSHLKWKQEIKEGRLGPDMYVASKRVGSFGMIEGWFMSWSQMFLNVRNSEEAELLVRELYEEGYDAVKVYSHLNKESYLAINKTAKELGMDVVGHIPWSLEFADILNSHQSDIAHLEEVMNAFRREFGKFEDADTGKFLEYVDKRSNEISAELVRNDISVTTTLWLVESFVRQKFDLDYVLQEVELEYENPGISEWDENVPQGLGWLPEVNRYSLPENLNEEEKASHKTFWNTYAVACQVILRNLAKNGVTIMAGTDANLPPTVPGFSLHDELVSMRNVGMTTTEVLQSATSVPADRLKNNTGKMEIGRKANLVLLDKNPLVDINNTKAINSVILDGKVLDRAMLDQILTAVKDANNSSRTKDINRYIDNNKYTSVLASTSSIIK